jgi:hypothetical protein
VLGKISIGLVIDTVTIRPIPKRVAMMEVTVVALRSTRNIVPFVNVIQKVGIKKITEIRFFFIYFLNWWRRKVVSPMR